MSDYSIQHQLNIWVHVLTGSLAMLLALIAMTSKKGGKLHKRSGKMFLLFMTIVIITGILGVLVYKANYFLLVLTLLSGYQAFSGFRILGNKTSIPKLLDIVVALTAFLSGIYFLYFIEKIGMIWNPGIIYGTVGALFLIITYDFLRYFFPKNKFKNRWLYEHIYKMIASFTALLAAFIGTILPEYKPYSQFLPSIFGTLLALSFVFLSWKRLRNKCNKMNTKKIPENKGQS